GRETPPTTSPTPTTTAGSPPAIQTPASPTGSWPRSVSNDPTRDQAAKENTESEKVAARVRWRGTAFVWSHDVTTSALGVGSDFQSTSHQVYTQGYALTLNYY